VLLVLTTPEIVDATGMQLEFIQLGGPLRSGLIPLWVGQSDLLHGGGDADRARPNGGHGRELEHARPTSSPAVHGVPSDHAAIDRARDPRRGLLAFTFALDNVIISDFVKAPGTNTFPTYVFGLAKTVMKPEVASMATVLIGVTLFSLVVAALILRRTGDDSSKIAATSLVGADASELAAWPLEAGSCSSPPSSVASAP
jgi:hypothetical protein